MTAIPEPPDTSIVGWGQPVRLVYVRDDEGAKEAHYDEGDHWFDVADDSSVGGPMRWDSLCATNAYDGDPYLLVPTPLSGTP